MTLTLTPKSKLKKERTDGQIWANLKQIQCFHLIGSQRKFKIFQLKRNDCQIAPPYKRSEMLRPVRSSGIQNPSRSIENSDFSPKK